MFKALFFLASILLCALRAEVPSFSKTIYITKGYHSGLGTKLNPFDFPDDTDCCFYRLFKTAAKRGIRFVEVETGADLKGDFECLICFDVFPDQIATFSQVPKEKLILVLWEPPSVLPQDYDPRYHEHFSRVYTWNDILVNEQERFLKEKRYFKFYYPALRPMIEKRPEFSLKEFATLIAGNKWSSHPHEIYSERYKAALFFEENHPNEFDLWGSGWPTILSVYRGLMGDKTENLKYYKFCFSYENVKGEPGYVTEKIFDCFRAGVIPIYWGAPNVADYIPNNCYIAREDFSSDEELYSFLKSMSEETYSEYIENIRRYLASERAQLFSIDNFVTIFMDMITRTNARN